MGVGERGVFRAAPGAGTEPGCRRAVSRERIAALSHGCDALSPWRRSDSTRPTTGYGSPGPPRTAGRRPTHNLVLKLAGILVGAETASRAVSAILGVLGHLGLDLVAGSTDMFPCGRLRSVGVAR